MGKEKQTNPKQTNPKEGYVNPKDIKYSEEQLFRFIQKMKEEVK